MRQLGIIVTDRGSKYAVSGAPIDSRDAAKAYLKALKRNKSYAKAGAGMVIVRMLQREALQDHIIVVTRWFGGTHLGGGRFRHVRSCVRHYLDDLRAAGDSA